MLTFGKRSLNMAASAAVQAATKVLWGQPSAAPPHLAFGLSRELTGLGAGAGRDLG